MKILRTKRAELTYADYAHMRKVVHYARRHLARRPSSVVEDTAGASR